MSLIQDGCEWIDNEAYLGEITYTQKQNQKVGKIEEEITYKRP